ncbi:MAG: sugar transferase, partial [Opitutae bacterium]|nr:sugar transferase [Opitutae bacterium]
MEDWVSRVSELATQYGCRVLIYNNLSGLFDARLVFMEESGRQFFTLLNEPLESPFNQMVKRCFDLCLSIPALLILLPPTMLLVKIYQSMQAPGPIFFKQERVGLAGRKFVIWKFRSMTHAKAGERDESVQAHEGDDRIFAFGKFMRRFSIDELP